MRVYHVLIERFRGIKKLDWSVAGRCICLVGPGDSSKSTILDAVELALLPRYGFPFDDSDFHNCDINSPIRIAVTVGPVPRELAKVSRFGTLLRGWHPAEGLHDEPEGDDVDVLTVQLSVDQSLEPQWCVVREQNPEGKNISYRERQHFGVVRLGSSPDWELGWGRNSTLSRLTGAVDNLSDILARASRAARLHLDQSSNLLAELSEAASRAQTLGEAFGVQIRDKLQPNLDLQSISIRQGGITLHDGEVPFRRAGLGSRRLLVLALQKEAACEGGVTLIDEVEHGLEPHRVRQLVRNLKGDGPLEPSDQVLMATHSATAIEELIASDLGVVRSAAGAVEVRRVSSDLQDVVRGASEAFLARSVVVCEGKTEQGVCRALNRIWVGQGALPFETVGVVSVEGGGSSAPRRAKCLRELGYSTCFFGDADTELNPTACELEASGVKVVVWADGKSIEERVLADLPWEGVLELIGSASEDRDAESIRQAVQSRLSQVVLPPALADWPDIRETREAIAEAAQTPGKEWFKRVDLGEKLGAIIAKYLDQASGSDLTQKIAALRDWIYSDV